MAAHVAVRKEAPPPQSDRSESEPAGGAGSPEHGGSITLDANHD